MIILFWILIFIVFYTFFGYTFTLAAIAVFFKNKKSKINAELPSLTLLIAAYNEKDIIATKIKNSRELNYPKNKLKLMWVTDGSDDGTPEALADFSDVEVLHKNERKGKTAAINRAMDFVNSQIVVFTDANTMLNADAMLHIASRFENKKVGCVAGEKRIESQKEDSAPGAGEGFYWKYESVIKTLESKVGYCMGAAGELFALRTHLFEKVPDNSIIDDFVISLAIAQKGYKIDYAPDAYSTESGSLSITDEMKRKVRIASGGFQCLFGMPGLLNLFKHPMLSWQFISHKVSRWLFAPFAIPFIYVINFLLVLKNPVLNLYSASLLVQTLVILLIIIGGMMKNKVIRIKFAFIPYYFFIMNYSQILGLIRYVKGNHSVIWEKVNRRQ